MDGNTSQAEVQGDEQQRHDSPESPHAHAEAALPSKATVRPFAAGTFYLHFSDFCRRPLHDPLRPPLRGVSHVYLPAARAPTPLPGAGRRPTGFWPGAGSW
jgi:hypothetical protein